MNNLNRIYNNDDVNSNSIIIVVVINSYYGVVDVVSILEQLWKREFVNDFLKILLVYVFPSANIHHAIL